MGIGSDFTKQGASPFFSMQNGSKILNFVPLDNMYALAYSRLEALAAKALDGL